MVDEAIKVLEERLQRGTAHLHSLRLQVQSYQGALTEQQKLVDDLSTAILKLRGA